MMFRLLSLIVGVFVAACQTGYSELGLFGGVSAQPIGGGVYRIAARGNEFTSETRIQDLVLLRAAETALQAGGRGFVVMGVEDRTEVSSWTAPTTVSSFGSYSGNASFYGNSAYGSGFGSSYTTITPGQTSVFVAPGQDVMVRITRDVPAGAFDALAVYNAIGPRLGLEPYAGGSSASPSELAQTASPAAPAPLPQPTHCMGPTGQLQRCP